MAITSSQAEFQFNNFSLSPSNIGTDAFTTTFTSAEDESSTSSAEANAEALFDIIDNSTISETRSLTEGQGNAFFSLASSDTEVLGSFDVDAGETFSFNFDGFFNLSTSSNVIGSESIITAATFSLLLIDETIIGAPSVVGFFDLFAQLDTVGDNDLLFTPLSLGGVTVDLFDTDSSFGANNTTEFINAQFSGSFISSFDYSASLTLVQVQNSFAGISTEEPIVINTPPVAEDDRFSTGEDMSLFISIDDLLVNDSDLDDNFLIFEGIDNVANGTVEISGGGLIFNPDTDFNGLTSFSYTISDRRGGQDTANVDIFVKPRPDHPTIINGPNSIVSVIGTEQDDLITGGSGFQLINTNAGEDQLVYNEISDAFDYVTDFEVGEDSFDLVPLLESFNYHGSDPFGDGYINIFGFGNQNVITVDADGFSGHAGTRVLAVVQTVGAGTLDEDSVHF